MTHPQMNFHDIHRSLDQGSWLHRDLQSKNTARSGFSRFVVWIQKLLGQGSDYEIKQVSSAILQKAESDFDVLDQSEKEQAAWVIQKLKNKLDRLPTTQSRQLLLTRIAQLQLRFLAAGVNRHIFSQALVNPLHRDGPAAHDNPMGAKAEAATTQSNPMHPALPPEVASHPLSSLSAADRAAGAAKAEPSLPAPPLPRVIDRAFTPSELQPHLSKIFLKRGKSPVEIATLARDLCQVLNAKLPEIADIRGGCIPLDKNKAINVGGGRTITLPFSSWIKVNEAGMGMRLQIIPSGEAAIDKGSYKKVKKAFTFYLPVEKRPKGTRDIKVVESILARIRGGDKIERVRDGLIYQTKILQEAGSCARFVSIPESYTEYTGKDGTVKLEMYQEWFNGDLHKAVTTGQIPLDIDKTASRPITFRDKFTIICDVANSIATMHKAGIVHRDVKPANILLKEEEGAVRGYLADFDLATKPGMTTISSSYHYWDISSQYGYASFAADVMGCAMTVAETLIPGFYSLFSSDRSTLLAKAPDFHRLELSLRHMENYCNTANLPASKTNQIRDKFLELGGYSPAFCAWLSAQKSLSLKQLAVDIPYFNAMFSFICNVLAKDALVLRELRALSLEERSRMQAEPEYCASKFQKIVEAARFPDMEVLTDFFSTMQKGLEEDYTALGLI